MWQRDRHFWLALAFGPAFWVCFVLLGDAQPSWSGPVHWLTFALAALVYPVLEEMAFRGWIQGVLLPECYRVQQWAGLSVANVLTSLMFVGFHFLSHPPVWAVSVLLPSLTFGYFRDRYGIIGPSVALHVFYNFGFFWLFSSGN